MLFFFYHGKDIAPVQVQARIRELAFISGLSYLAFISGFAMNFFLGCVILDQFICLLWGVIKLKQFINL